MYPRDFPVFLQQRMRGKTADEMAAFLGVSDEYMQRLAAGHWHPSRHICRKLGLKVVYEITGEAGDRG
jgi:DNA-binding XRE family transcriptional regulator